MSRRRLLVLVILAAYGVAEVVLLLWIARSIGWLWLIAILAVQFAVGAAIVRRAGLAALSHMGDSARMGSLPGGQAGEAALTALGGALIALPGVLSDLLGLLLIIPPTRRRVRRLTATRVGRFLRSAGLGTVTTTADGGVEVTRLYDGTVVEGEVVERRDGPSTGPGSPLGLP